MMKTRSQSCNQLKKILLKNRSQLHTQQGVCRSLCVHTQYSSNYTLALVNKLHHHVRLNDSDWLRHRYTSTYGLSQNHISIDYLDDTQDPWGHKSEFLGSRLSVRWSFHLPGGQLLFSRTSGPITKGYWQTRTPTDTQLLQG